MVEIFSKQLEGLHANIFHLKHRIKELETEKSKNKFISYEKDKLDKLETENKKLRLENFELSETVNKLENKLFLTTENLTQLQAKCKENDYNLEKLDQLNNLQLKNKIKKQDQILKAQEENFLKVLEMRDTFRVALDSANEENKKLSFKVKKLSTNDINKKILNFAIEENENLQSALEMERDKIISLKNDNKIGEKNYENKIKENTAFRQEINRLRSVIESNLNDYPLTYRESKNDEWETCSESSVESLSGVKFLGKKDGNQKSQNSKMYVPSKANKNQKSTPKPT